MAYNKEAQKRYSEKTLTFAVKYYPTDIAEGERLKRYLKDSGMSANGYLKELIKRDMDSNGISYEQ